MSAATASLRSLRSFLALALLGSVAACGGGGGATGAAVAEGPAPDVQTPVDAAPSPVLDPVTGIPTGLVGTVAPARNFDLGHWKLTLPSGAEVKNPELVADYSLPGVFYTDPETGGMVFRTPNIGGTTANSNYSRTELREVLAPEGPNAADANHWRAEEGGVLTATLRVDHVSTTGEDRKVGRLIIGQIHGPVTEGVRLYYDRKPDEAKGRIYAAMENLANETRWSPDIVSNMGDEGIALGEPFAYEIVLAGTHLGIAVTLASGEVHTYETEIVDDYLGLNLYFKAGVYNQNNTGETNDYAQATFFALEASH